MRIPFRQGIVRAPSNFLQLSSNKVSINISSPDNVIVAFADNTTDYLIVERQAVPNAWAGPFVAGPDSYWLYWDINQVTGAKTYGHTTLSPVEGATAPSSPQTDQHWFDTISNTMKVWNGLRWVQKIRVFAAELTGGTVLASVSISSPLFTGTQVGALSSIGVSAGALVFDGEGKVVKHANGKFFTTEDVVVTGIASSTNVKFGSLVIEAEAVGALPAFGIVHFTDFNKVNVATNYMLDNAAYGIVETAASTGEVVNVTMEGLITNPSWDWTSAGINAPLYVDGSGNLTTTVPPTPVPVACVVDKSTILLRPSSLFLAIEHKSIVGTANQVTVTDGGTSLTLSLPQSIATTSNVQFAGVAAKTISQAVNTLTSGATVNWNVAQGASAVLVLDTNATLANPTNMVAGSIITIKVQQDATGGHTLAFGNYFRFAGGVAPVVSAGADEVTMLSFWCDGTYSYELSRSLAVA